jgi:AcrR family transcriptional regulator
MFPKHRRRKAPSSDRRTEALQNAGLLLLSSADYETISISRIARHAGCSVGAFYYRYQDKVTYLKLLIASTFGQLSRDLEKELSSQGTTATRGKIKLTSFVAHVVSELSRKEVAGVIRAALKLGQTDLKALHYYENYRAQVTRDAEKLFKGASKKSPPSRQIREATQILFATINDAIQCPHDAAMKLGSVSMRETLTDVFTRTIGARKDFSARALKPGRYKTHGFVEIDSPQTMIKQPSPNKQKRKSSPKKQINRQKMRKAI